MRKTLRDRGIVVVGLVAGSLALGVAAPCPVRADDAADARQLVEKARHTVETFSASPVMNAFRDAVKRAKGVFVSRSDGWPKRYFGMMCAPRRMARNVRSEMLDVSTAMSAAELPIPTTSTRRPAYGSGVL